MKMSDVFEGDVINDADTLIAHGYGELADFSGYKKECRYVAHAINNHDRLASENARLRDALKDCISSLQECYDVCDYPASGESPQDLSIKMAESLLTELEKQQ